MSKRIVAILLSVVLCFSLWASIAPAMAANHESTYLKVTANTNAAHPGDTIDFTITMGPVSDMGSMQMVLDIPEGTQYAPFVLGEDKPLGVHVEPGGTGEVIWYTYPSFAWSSGGNSPYTLGIVTEGNNEGYSPRQFLDGSGQALNSLQRNVQLNINASISAEAQLIIKFEVTQWKGETIEVPPFD